MTDVRGAEPGDADEIGRVWAEGFAQDPVMTWVFSEPGRPTKLRAFFTFLAREAYVPMGATEIAAGGAAGWTPPDPEPWPPERNDAFTAMLTDHCRPQDVERLAILDSVTTAHHPTASHWYLGILAVDDAHRAQGLGGRLLGHSLARVDDAGMPAFLESTNPRNLTLYERHGFEVVEQVPLVEGGPVITPMWREARTR